MLRQPLARLKIGAACCTPLSNSASMPGLTSICAISVIMLRPRLVSCKGNFRPHWIFTARRRCPPHVSSGNPRSLDTDVLLTRQGIEHRDVDEGREQECRRQQNNQQDETGFAEQF